MLTGPWITLSYINPKKNNQKGFVVFMRKRGHTVDEFLYLIEYLTHHHVIAVGHEVTIRILDPHPNSSSNFDKAKDQYIEGYDGGEEFKKLLDAIDCGRLEDVRTEFCDKELSRP